MAKKTSRKKSGFRVGSRKDNVYRVYDKKGRDAAMRWGLENGLKESTLKQWISAWRSAAVK
jgi:hypothetical protein